jgi:hypothetical protein
MPISMNQRVQPIERISPLGPQRLTRDNESGPHRQYLWRRDAIERVILYTRPSYDLTRFSCEVLDILTFVQSVTSRCGLGTRGGQANENIDPRTKLKFGL